MPAPADPDLRPYGRRAFLGVVALGLSSLAWGESAWRTLASVLPSPVSGWRIYNVNPPMPRFDRATWGLRIEGLVEKPLELSYREFLALPRVEQVSDFHCVTGWSVENVRWGASASATSSSGPSRSRARGRSPSSPPSGRMSTR